MDHRPDYLKKADSLKPALHVLRVRPAENLPSRAMAEGESLLLDFGNHHVGHVTLKLGYTGSHPDAPAWLRLKFCESARELNETVEGYKGWISKGWIQEEQVHVDVLPCELSLARRYAFRYLRVEVLAVSMKFRLTVEDAWVDSTTSADDHALAPFSGTPEEEAIDRVATRTLRSCMQDFFEDGPKRDRRLWLGDLRLQALTSYATFHGDDLVKRCLYLFAAAANDDGQLTACLFTEPKLEGDDNWMADYALFFISTLKDYVEHTGDLETGRDLLPVALKQLELSESYFDPETQLVRDGNAKSLTRKKQAEGPELCANMVDQSAFFIDWNLALNKQAAGQAVWIYCAKDALRLMDILGESAGRDDIAARIDGCNEYRILFQIVVPLSLPMMVTLILMMGLGYWNDWMNSLYYVTDEKLFSIQAILNTIITNIQFITSGQGSLASNVDMSKLPSVGVRMAIAIVGIIPVLIIYPFFQKYFVRGIVVGGVKG